MIQKQQINTFLFNFDFFLIWFNLISFEKRRNESHKDDIAWKDIAESLYSDGKNTKTARKKLLAHMMKMEKLLDLKGTTLQEIIPKFCNHYNDIDVFVICPQESYNNYKYSYPETGSELNENYKIFLYQEKIGENERVYFVKVASLYFLNNDSNIAQT